MSSARSRWQIGDLDYNGLGNFFIYRFNTRNEKMEYFGFSNNKEYSRYPLDPVRDRSDKSRQRWMKFGNKLKNVGSGECLAYAYNNRYLFIIKSNQ